MKKLIMALAATAALCFGLASCNNVQDVNVTNAEAVSKSYIYTVTGTVTNGGTATTVSGDNSYALLSVGQGVDTNYTTYSLSVSANDANKATVSVSSVDNISEYTFYKINDKFYAEIDDAMTDVTSRFTSGTPDSDTFTYAYTKDANNSVSLTFTKK